MSKSTSSNQNGQSSAANIKAFSKQQLTSLPNTKIPKLASLRSGSGSGKKSTTLKKSASNVHRSAHFVYKRKVHDETPHSDFMELEPGQYADRKADLGLSPQSAAAFNWTMPDSDASASSAHYSNSSGQGHSRSKRQSPDTVWPEVLLVVDYDSYLLHGANSRDVKRYFISFWNGVDLRYKLLSHPRIRVSLAGMIVAKVRHSCAVCNAVECQCTNA